MPHGTAAANMTVESEVRYKTMVEVRRQMHQFRYSDFLRALPAAESLSRDARPLRVAVLRTYTVEPIEPILRLHLIVEGFTPEFWIGGYNQYIQEIVDPRSGLYSFKPDLVILFTRIEELLPDFLDEFPRHSASHWRNRIDAKAAEFGALAERLEGTMSAQLMVQNIVLPGDGYFGVHDRQQPEGQSQMVNQFNDGLASALAERRGAFVWDFEQLVRRQGYNNLFDPKGWYVSRSPWVQGAYPRITSDLMRYVRSALGIMRKCVVLDLDNTLWGGVVGEDGVEGVALGHSYPGNCYRDFQKELLKLYERGVLLAINSKNNPEDAYAVVDGHPDMVLRREHFAATRINWNNKAANLRELAAELNIGVDSFIFVDDNPAECALIGSEFPQCEVVQLPDKPYLLPEVARTLPGVENIRLTEEDRRKGEMYRAQAARTQLEASYENVEDFLRTLDIQVTIEPAGAFSIPRIAQLTQKTNQFNMTTRRYTEPQIQRFVSDPGCDVYSVATRDRFGDEGIVGVFILRHGDDAATIDTLLLSCRVIGRGIEEAVMTFVAGLSRRRGARRLIGEFLPTAKNSPASALYASMGFSHTGETTYEIDLDHVDWAFPDHLNVSTPAHSP
jgi:FkbH-like protein